MFPLWQKSLCNTVLFVIFYGDKEGEGDEKQKTGEAGSSGVDPQVRNCLKDAMDLTKGEPGPSIFPSRN